jgi:hypothetical protein
MDEHQIARGLALFSIALGLAEVTMPGALEQMLGVSRGKRLIQLFGLREIAAGVGILTQRPVAPWLWSRVAGDALDLGALTAAAFASRKRAAVAAVIGSVVLITAMDVVCAGQLTREEA